MTIRNTPHLYCLLIVILIAFGCSNKKESENVKRPNIIWLMAEDISIDLECYGTKGVQTPNLNRLAVDGVKFENAYVTNPICSPSRSSMLIGVHQIITNTHNHRSNRQIPLDSAFKPFTYHLRNAGYTTILGHHGVRGRGRKIDVNFKHEPIGEWDGKTKFGIFDKRDTFKVADQPFFAQIQLQTTHRGDWWDEVREKSTDPVNPDSVELPPYMADHPVIRLDWAKYLDQMEFIDNEVGMIVQELEDKGMADNTIIIFIGDNGRCNIRGKGYLHDPGLHIPLIIYDPRVEGGKVSKQVVSATDITATVLDYAGAKLPDYLTGKPIFSEDFDRQFVFGARDQWDEIMEKSRAVTSGKWKYIRNDKPEQSHDMHQAYLEFYRPSVHVMRTLKAEGKLSETEQTFFKESKPIEELYDLENDPQELNNLALNPEYRAIADQMKQEMFEYESVYVPVSDIYEPTEANLNEMIAWIRETRPDQYQQMLEGVEIGFHRLSKEYRDYLKETK
ncbi:MAG: sulfatase [Cyclobacteriaceae bacterium]